MREDSSEVSGVEGEAFYEQLEEALGLPRPPPVLDSRNIFFTALAPDSDGGGRVTEAEFMVAVFQLTAETGEVTGSVVERVRRDWEALSALAPYPVTEEAHEAYAAFVEEHGLLPLIESVYRSR